MFVPSPPKIRRRPFAMGFGIGLLCLLWGCSEPPAAVEPPPPKVTIAHPEVRELIDYDEYNGWTAASETVEVRSRVQGGEVAVLPCGALLPFGFGGLGGTPKRLLDRRASRGLAEGLLRAVEELEVDLDRGALDHAHTLPGFYVQHKRRERRLQSRCASPAG